MVVVDHNKNLQRIISRLKADTAVFDEGETTGKPRQILFGSRPNDQALDEKMKPYIYCTTRNSLQNTRRDFGVSTSDSINQTTTEYEINVIADSRSRTERMEEQLYDIIKNTRTALEFDPLFSDPDDQGSDPVFSRSAISDVIWDTDSRGKLTGIVTIILLATIGSEFTITIPGIGLIPLLSQPNAPEGIVFQDDKTQNGSVLNRVITENGDFGSLDVEYESTETLDSAFRAKIFAGIEEAVTLNVGTANERTLTVKYIDINPTAQFDAIRRSIFHMEIAIH